MITVNMQKAKEIAHDMRRAARAAEFAPLDVKATIPSEAKMAEDARKVVRAKYDAMQIAIDASHTEDDLKTALGISGYGNT